MPKTEKNRAKKNISRKGGMLSRRVSRFPVPKRNFLSTHNKLGTGLNVLYPLSLLYKKQKVPADFSLPSGVNADISSELNKYPALKIIVDEEKLKDFFRNMFYNILTRKQNDGKRNGGSRALTLSGNHAVALRGKSTFPWKAYIAFFIGIIALCFSLYQAYLLNPRRHLNEFLENDPNANVYIKVFEGLEEYEPVDFYGIPYPNVMSIVKSASIFALSVALEIAKNDYKSTLTRIVGGEQTDIPKKVFQYIKVGYFFVKRNLAGKVVEYSNRKIARSVGEIQDTIGIYTGKVEDDIGIGIVLASVGVTLITASSPSVIRHLKLLYKNSTQAISPANAPNNNSIMVANSELLRIQNEYGDEDENPM